MTRPNYTYIEEIVAAAKRAGSHFFDKDTMRFFRSRVLDDVIGGDVFITSERFVSHYPTYHVEPRKYTVRRITTDGSITEVSEFQAYSSPRQARKAATEYVNTRDGGAE